MQSVLVVDDHESFRTLVRTWVDSLGYRAREADSADAAMWAMEREAAAAVIVDVEMPGHGGVWLAGRVRESFPHTAVIMATAARDMETAVASLRNEVVDYLLKPFDRARLAEALALARDWHCASSSVEDLHHAIQDRLRQRRFRVATGLARAQQNAADALHGLISILQLHERDGRGHATRVARLSAAIGDELGMDDEALERLELGAFLHDIGKLSMPASILSKAAPLDDREWRVMRTHPQVGYELLRRQPHLAMAAEIVLSHHEAFDGSGYPRGLNGTSIPLAARVLAVADAYDSMTLPHTQRPALPPAMAIEEIERCSGRQFDPGCAAALGPVLAHAGETLHDEHEAMLAHAAAVHGTTVV
jgi:putative nucleotidyltransferase with HDIG domain